MAATLTAPMPPLIQVESQAPRERPLLQRPYSLLLRTSLGLALAGGFGLGLYLVLGFAGLAGIPVTAAAPSLIQAHGQVQSLGFVALFIMAVGVQLIPRFHNGQVDRPTWVSCGGLGLAAGVAMRLVAQPLEPSAIRGAALVASALLEMGGVLLAVAAFARVVRDGKSPVERQWWRVLLPATMGSSLLGGLALNVVATTRMAIDGSPVVPQRLDEALLHLQIWGFAASMVLAVAGRVFPRFLLLQPTRTRALPFAYGCWLFGSLGTPLAWLLAGDLPLVRAVFAGAQFLGALLIIDALRLFEAPVRASGMPQVTNPTRIWARVAFGLLVLAALTNLSLALDEGLTPGSGLAGTTALSAARHLLAQGFFLPVIVFMAARILPGYSGVMLRRPRLLAGLVWTLILGAVVRATAELVGGYGSGWSMAVALGGLAGTVAFTIFAVGLWRATDRVPRPVL